MKQYTSSVRATLAVVVMFVSLLVGVQPVAAQGVSCDSGFGTKVPVLLVHGFNSNPRMWSEGGASSMSSALRKLDGIKIVAPFDYESSHFDWVTSSNIGPKLATTIDCLSQASRKGGGSGKVIVVAHSMGGLATRDAASRIVDGRKIADELGLVVTLGTPNTGSPWSTYFGSGVKWVCGFLVGGSGANHDRDVEHCKQSGAVKGMSENSRELRELPPFPKEVPVRAIAGKVRVFVQALFGTVVDQRFSDDMVVPVESATADYTSSDIAGGKFIFACDLRHYDSYGSIVHFQGGECSHNSMYKTGYIQESVTNGINEYLEAQPKPVSALEVPVPNFTNFEPGATIEMFDRLTIPSPQVWEGAMSEPDTVWNFIDRTICTADGASCPHVNFVNLASNKSETYFGSDPVKTWSESSCSVGIPGNLEGPAEITLGGQLAQVYGQRCGEDRYAAPRYAWLVPDKQLLVVMTDSGGAPEILEGALERVEWK